MKFVIVIYDVENKYRVINMHVVAKNLVNIVIIYRDVLYTFHLNGTEKYRLVINSCLIYHSTELQI